MPYVLDAISFVTEVFLGTVLVAVILRLLFKFLVMDVRNPIAMFIIAATNPPITFLRRFLPSSSNVDLATLILVILVAFFRYFLEFFFIGYIANPVGVLVYGMAQSINITCWILLIAIIGAAILSWVAPDSYHPIARMARDISNPTLAPFRRMLPNLGGLDISPIFAFLAINLIQRLIVNPLIDFGSSLLV